ncbi:hypothetical protein F4804DRAFT_337808 [Jackrogersella minutella]|nr:hypothetical protein F4804DRAFT_337808 [Jackrogersella minutella]
MQFSKIAIIAFLSGVGLAAPSAAGLSKRARESIHMVNCQTYVAVDYYADDSNDGSFPGNNNECIPSGGSFHEGSSTSCTFGSGVSFSWFLSSGANSASDGTDVGTGSNGFHNFNCFRDDNHVLYTDGNGHACSSTYVCFDVRYPHLNHIIMHTETHTI